ncbi:hypothetical protein ACWELV_36145, partial [Streptomyces mirabilis]
MRSKPTRLARLLVTLALLSAGAGAVAGCGSERAAGSGVETPGSGVEAPGTGQEPRAESHARRVTDAWDGSEAARQRRRGYHPIAAKNNLIFSAKIHGSTVLEGVKATSN